MMAKSSVKTKTNIFNLSQIKKFVAVNNIKKLHIK